MWLNSSGLCTESWDSGQGGVLGIALCGEWCCLSMSDVALSEINDTDPG